MDIYIIRKFNDWTLFTYKNLFGLIPGRLKCTGLGKSARVIFWVPMPKVVDVVS